MCRNTVQFVVFFPFLLNTTVGNGDTYYQCVRNAFKLRGILCVIIAKCVSVSRLFLLVIVLILLKHSNRAG